MGLSEEPSDKRKHGVSFEQASQVFLDPLRISTLDREIDGEERWQTLGVVDGLLLLLVAHTLWEEQEGQEALEVVRIISARKVTPNGERNL